MLMSKDVNNDVTMNPRMHAMELTEKLTKRKRRMLASWYSRQNHPY